MSASVRLGEPPTPEETREIVAVLHELEPADIRRLTRFAQELLAEQELPVQPLRERLKRINGNAEGLRRLLDEYSEQ